MSSTLGLCFVGLTLGTGLTGATSFDLGETPAVKNEIRNAPFSFPSYTSQTVRHASYASKHSKLWSAMPGILNPSETPHSKDNGRLDLKGYVQELHLSLILFHLHGPGFERSEFAKKLPLLLTHSEKDLLFGNVLAHAWTDVTAVMPQPWTGHSAGPNPLPFGHRYLWNDLLDLTSLEETVPFYGGWLAVPAMNTVNRSSRAPLTLRVLPTPGLLFLLGTGLVGLAFWRRQVRRRESTIRALFPSATPADELFLQQVFSNTPPYPPGHNHAAPRTPLESP